MSIEPMLYEYNEFVDLLGAVRELQLADVSDERREQLLRVWVQRVGGDYADWMTSLVTGAPAGGDEPAELEVIVG